MTMPGKPTSNAPEFDRTVFAHRGLSSKAPENTFAAFTLAADSGATWLETDVDILADGTPILIHDTTLDRTTNHSGSLYELTAEDLPHIDAGSWFSPEFSGEKIPTLHEFIEFLNERGMNANIEIKQNEQGAARTQQLVEAVARELANLDPDRQVVVSSFSQPLLMKFHEHAPQYAIGVLYETVALYDDWLSVLELCGATYIHVEDAGLTQGRVRQFVDAGYGVNVWTVNANDRANQLFNWGCSGVFTDNADRRLTR